MYFGFKYDNSMELFYALTEQINLTEYELINLFLLLTDKPDVVNLVVKTTEGSNCSDLLWANLMCKASDANPPVEHFQLYKNGKILSTLREGTWIRDNYQKQESMSIAAGHCTS